MSVAARKNVSVDEIKHATRQLGEVRVKSNEAACDAIRIIERELVDALAPDTLRGLFNLLPERGAVVFKGARVTTEKISAPLPHDGRPVLVIDHRGNLRLVARRTTGDVITCESRPPIESELVADVLESFVRTVRVVLAAHLARTDMRAREYRRLHVFAEKLSKVVAVD